MLKHVVRKKKCGLCCCVRSWFVYGRWRERSGGPSFAWHARRRSLRSGSVLSRVAATNALNARVRPPWAHLRRHGRHAVGPRSGPSLRAEPPMPTHSRNAIKYSGDRNTSQSSSQTPQNMHWSCADACAPERILTRGHATTRAVRDDVAYAFASFCGIVHAVGSFCE